MCRKKSWWLKVLLIANTYIMGVSSLNFFAHPIPVHSKGILEETNELYFEQQIDHFSQGSVGDKTTFQQRYFINDEYFLKDGPMFFYLGNEADVTLYVNATGLMWENAAEFGALIVFAEHRYYGKSHINKDDPLSNLSYLSVEQALMDYVTLINHLKKEYNFDVTDAVIGFGGSYGGMLASWARFHYPFVWDGAVAASAPIISFEGMDANPNFFAEGVTYDVSEDAGESNQFCEVNLRHVFAYSALDDVDPSQIRSAFQICDDDNTPDSELGSSVTSWINEALSMMSMANFPYPSSYILNGDGVLPSYPVRKSCEYLSEDLTGDDQVGELLIGLANFAGVYYNHTNSLICNDLSAPVNKESQIVMTLWNYQYCSQIFQLFGQETDRRDMFGNFPWNANATAESCFSSYGFYPDRYHFPLNYGLPVDWERYASNIVWSQGEYDPWRGGGVVENINDSLLAVIIEGGAHHLDLFFSHKDDPDSVIAARELEMSQVRKWINEKKQQKSEKDVMLGVI